MSMSRNYSFSYIQQSWLHPTIAAFHIAILSFNITRLKYLFLVLRRLRKTGSAFARCGQAIRGTVNCARLSLTLPVYEEVTILPRRQAYRGLPLPVSGAISAVLGPNRVREPRNSADSLQICPIHLLLRRGRAAEKWWAWVRWKWTTWAHSSAAARCSGNRLCLTDSRVVEWI